MGAHWEDLIDALKRKAALTPNVIYAARASSFNVKSLCRTIRGPAARFERLVGSSGGGVQCGCLCGFRLHSKQL